MTTTHDSPASELAAIRRAYRVVSTCVWALAVGVMVYGIPIAYDLATDVHIPKEIAWLLSPLVDAALCFGLVATPLLAHHKKRASWVGAMRWVAGATTWFLQTATAWTGPDGPDWLSVATHSIGPVLLFMVVEAASYFQRQMGDVIADLTAKQEQRDARQRSDQAERDALRRKVADLTAQRGDVDAVRLTVDQQTATITALRADLEAAEARRVADLEHLTVTLNATHDETVKALKERHTAALARARAEGSTVNLTAYRNKANGAANGKGSPKPANRPSMTDETAVQAMLDKTRDPNFEWSQNAVRELTGAGFERAKKLIAEWRLEVTGDRNGEATA